MLYGPLEVHEHELLTRAVALVAKGQLYAVFDGAALPQLEKDLARSGVSHRPLYHYNGDYALVSGGPWAANLARRRLTEENLSKADIVKQVEATIRIAHGRTALVFWAGDDSLTWQVFINHIRRLNVVAWREDSKTCENTAALRHGDGSALYRFLQVLTPQQGSDLIGPAIALLFYQDNGGNAGVKGAHKESKGTILKQRLLLDAAQMAALENRHDHYFAAELCRELQSLPTVSTITEAETRRYIGELRPHGVKLRVSYAQWCHIRKFYGAKLPTVYLFAYLRDQSIGQTSDLRIRYLAQFLLDIARKGQR